MKIGAHNTEMSFTAILMITWWISQNSGIKVLQIPLHSKEKVRLTELYDISRESQQVAAVAQELSGAASDR